MAGDDDNSGRQKHSLVLTIFKGENFVTKGSGCHAFVRAKCSDVLGANAGQLDSTAVRLHPTCTDPDFYSQLVWQVSRKELKTLRSNRSTIKVSCIIVDDRTKKESEIGYVVMHVKDATTFSTEVDINNPDSTKAKSYTLLGTKDAWRSVQPKLQMILHLEDPALLDREAPKGKFKAATNPVDSNDHEPERVKFTKTGDAPFETDAAPKSLEMPKSHNKFQLEPLLNKFVWTVNDEDGHFQLGAPADHDDLYIFNITIISGTNFHVLWDGKSPRKQQKEYVWQVTYSAFGCDITAEPFMLGNDDSTRRTFIGDKACARIRANGLLFFEYLQETSLQFQIIRYQVGINNELISPEVMGFCYADLSLLSGNRHEIKLSMDVVSEWGTTPARTIASGDATTKPEIRLAVNMEAIPNYFSNQLNENGNKSIQDAEQRSKIYTNGHIQSDAKDESKKVVLESNLDQVDGINEANVTEISNSSNVRRLLQFENDNHKDYIDTDDYDVLGNSSNVPSKSVPKKRQEQPVVANCGDTLELSESEDSDFAQNFKKIASLMPEPGDYKVVIEFTSFWLKSGHILQKTYILRYSHPPIGIEEPVDCYANRLEDEFTDPCQRYQVMIKGSPYPLTIKEYSEALLNEPLTVEFHKFHDAADGTRCFATAMIPIGRIFFSEPLDSSTQLRTFSNTVDIWKRNNAKIGTLTFEIRLERNSRISDLNRKTEESAFFPPRILEAQAPPSTEKYFKDVEEIDKFTREMRKWTKTQEEIYSRQKEDKETAYLKILSEEAAKRDAERESLMTKKLAELEFKEKELIRQKRQLDEKEERLNKLDFEIKEKSRELTLKQESIVQNAELTRRKFEADYQIEMDSLKRKMANYKAENESLKTKILLLEKKLETKDSEIDKLIELKREQQNSKLVERVTKLEQDNNLLRHQLKESNTRREQYKKQMQAMCHKVNLLQAERDKDLRETNENLRLQILATKEHKELKKERKTVNEISQTIKALRKETVPNECKGAGDRPTHQPQGPSELAKRPDAGARSCLSKDLEIRRLQEERSKLLSTGAYNQYDVVISELEKKMISLSHK